MTLMLVKLERLVRIERKPLILDFVMDPAPGTMRLPSPSGVKDQTHSCFSWVPWHTHAPSQIQSGTEITCCLCASAGYTTALHGSFQVSHTITKSIGMAASSSGDVG